MSGQADPFQSFLWSKTLSPTLASMLPYSLGSGLCRYSWAFGGLLQSRSAGALREIWSTGLSVPFRTKKILWADSNQALPSLRQPFSPCPSPGPSFFGMDVYDRPELRRLQATLNPRVQGSWCTLPEPAARIFLSDVCLLHPGQQEKPDTALQNALRRRKDLLQRLWVGLHPQPSLGLTLHGLIHRLRDSN